MKEDWDILLYNSISCEVFYWKFRVIPFFHNHLHDYHWRLAPINHLHRLNFLYIFKQYYTILSVRYWKSSKSIWRYRELHSKNNRFITELEKFRISVLNDFKFNGIEIVSYFSYKIFLSSADFIVSQRRIGGFTILPFTRLEPNDTGKFIGVASWVLLSIQNFENRLFKFSYLGYPRVGVYSSRSWALIWAWAFQLFKTINK